MTVTFAEKKIISQFDNEFAARFGSHRVGIGERASAIQFVYEFAEAHGLKNAQPNLSGYVQSSDTHVAIGWIDENCDLWGAEVAE